ncbi:MAG TPA: PQQ-binding-like beta-propeller repeat protein, partial [Pirellulaceae bacterium]|nr:PQQ-binding-like beta-propeller repeat protein [Pirellulaceae bacterium]
IVWQKEVHRAVPREGLHETNTYASASAVTDGQRLFASFGSFGIYCLSLDGDVLWSRDLGNMRTRNAFGEGGSPALHGDTLVVPWDHEGPSQLFALDASTGETRWQVDRDEPTTWATPLITEFNGQLQVVTNGTNRVRSYDLADGTLIWEAAGQVANPIPTPLRIDDMVICMTGYRGFAIQAIKLTAKGDATRSSSMVWSRNDSAPYVSSAVLDDGKLFFTKSRDAIISVVDARKGEVLVAQTRLPGLDTIYASPLAAGGRVYFAGRNGNTTVVEHRDGELHVLATNELGETIDASPIAIGDQLYIRGEHHVFCIAEKNRAP